MRRLRFTLTPTPPFRLDLTAWALRRRPENAIDRWDGRAYRRVLLIDEQPVAVTVTQSGGPVHPRLRVDVGGALPHGVGKAAVRRPLERLLGLRVDLQPFYRRTARDPRFGALVRRFRGLKPPQFPSVFETLVNGIACQQLTLFVGLRLLNRLTEAYGARVTEGTASGRAFPTPATLARVQPQALRRLGFSTHKARAVVELSRAIVEHRCDVEALEDLDDAAALERLEALRGIGRWTAEYVLLRGLRRLRSFPGDDVGARNNLARHLRRRTPMGYDAVRRAVARWQPYAGFLYFHLLLAHISAAGWLQADPAAKETIPWSS